MNHIQFGLDLDFESQGDEKNMREVVVSRLREIAKNIEEDSCIQEDCGCSHYHVSDIIQYNKENIGDWFLQIDE